MCVLGPFSGHQTSEFEAFTWDLLEAADWLRIYGVTLGRWNQQRRNKRDGCKIPPLFSAKKEIPNKISTLKRVGVFLEMP